MAQQDTPELNNNAVRDAISQALPQANLGDQPCCRIEEGTEHSVWSIGDYIFRGLSQTGRPNGRHETSLGRDRNVTDLVRQFVPNPNCIPRVLATISIGAWIGNIETKLPGHSLRVVDPTQQTEDELVALLNALARIPQECAVEATQYEEPSPNLRSRLTKAIRAWQEQLVPTGVVRDPDNLMIPFLEDTHARVKRMANDAPPYSPCLIHGDIAGEHVLVDEVGHIKGIIDWSDARVGDPCWDIAGTALSVGRRAAAWIGEKSDHHQYTVQRGLFFAMCLALQDLGNSLLGKDKATRTLLEFQYVRAFEATGLESLLVQSDAKEKAR